MCSSQTARPEKHEAATIPPPWAPPVPTPRPVTAQTSFSSPGVRKVPCIAKSAAAPWPGKFPPDEVVLQEVDGEVKILVYRMLAQPYVGYMAITPKSSDLFQRVQIAVATNQTFSHSA